MDAYKVFVNYKENIFSAFKLDIKDESLDIFFEAVSREFASFTKNMKALNVKISKEHILGFFTTSMFKIMQIKTCNPAMLEDVCKMLANEIGEMV